MAKLFNLVPNHQVITFRNGKQEAPPIGKAYKFTAAEVQQILTANPGSLRDPIDENTQSSEQGPATAESLLAEATRELAKESKLLNTASEQAQRDAEEEAQRLAAEEEARRLAAEEEARLLAAEAEKTSGNTDLASGTGKGGKKGSPAPSENKDEI